MMAGPAECSARSAEDRRSGCSLLFYRAVRDRKPVWMLEDIRTMEALYQEEDCSLRTYSPSEALLYAIVHDHRPYARHLLSHYRHRALATPGERFCCCPSSAPHLAMAVRYDRYSILGLILQESRGAPGEKLQDRGDRGQRSRCFHGEDGRTPLHLACELLRPEAVFLLLGSGASPLVPDRDGMTPLDLLLDKLRDSGPERDRERRRCLDHLLLFMWPLRFKLRAALLRDPECWARLLGEDTSRYLSGRSPAPLLRSAMTSVLRQLRPDGFPENLQQLPIPSSLKPAALDPD